MSTRMVRFSWLSALLCVLMGLLASPVRAANWPEYEMPPEATTYQPAVKTIQYLLRAHGYQAAADGRFGLQTQNMVQKFQRSRGLHDDGAVGSQTWQRLIVRLQKGSHGDAVRALQALLRDLGSTVGVDGNFGNQTRLAIRKFQRAYNLSVDGVVGPATWNKLIQAAYNMENHDE